MNLEKLLKTDQEGTVDARRMEILKSLLDMGIGYAKAIQGIGVHRIAPECWQVGPDRMDANKAVGKITMLSLKPVFKNGPMHGRPCNARAKFCEGFDDDGNIFVYRRDDNNPEIFNFVRFREPFGADWNRKMEDHYKKEQKK